MNLSTILNFLPLVARFLPGQAGEALTAVLPGLQKAAPAFQKAAPELVVLGEQVAPLFKSVLALVGKHMEDGLPQAEAIATAADKIADLHQMTPDEEQAWFDRASQSFGAG